jgi:hypothetical protein
MLRSLIFTGFAALMAIAAPAASAAPLDVFQGTASFSDTSPVLNNPVYFTGSFAQPSFTFSPTAIGQTFTDKLTVTAFDVSLQFLATYHDNVQVSLDFTLPNDLSTTIGGDGSLTNAFIFIGYLDGGNITWNGPSTLAFNDGSVLTATMDNISVRGFDGIATGSGNLNLTLTKVPEPATTAMFGLGLLALGFFAMRRKSLGLR